MKLLSKFFLPIFLLVGICYLLATSKPAFAQTSTQYTDSPSFTNTTSDVQPTLNNKIQIVLIDVFSSFLCQLSGKDFSNQSQPCLAVSPQTNKIGFANNTQYGLLGLMATTTDSLYNNFPHTSDYVKYLSSHFGVATAYAASPTQGVGFAGISSLISIWVVIRNVAYLFIVLVFVFIGLAIMLRVKIDPRTVMTIENQIPKIIIGLIAITFSFAISGLLIDLMYVLVYAFYGIYLSIPNITHTLSPNILQGNTPLGVVNYLVPGGIGGVNLGAIGVGGLNLGGIGISGMASNIAGSLSDLIKTMLGINGVTLNPFDFLNGPWSRLVGSTAQFNPFGFGIDAVSWLIAGKAFWGIYTIAKDSTSSIPFIGGAGDLAGIGVGTVTAAAIYETIDNATRNILPFIIVYLVVFLALFLALVKLLFALLTAWVTVLYYIVLAPLFIFFGLIPGVEGGFTSWLKNLSANLLAFPITAAILLLGSAIISVFSNPANVGNIFIPPLIGGGSLPVASLLGITIIFIASNGPQIAKDIFKIKDDKNSAALGTFLGGGISTLVTAGKATYAGFGKTVKPGDRGGVQGILGQLH